MSKRKGDVVETVQGGRETMQVVPAPKQRKMVMDGHEVQKLIPPLPPQHAQAPNKTAPPPKSKKK